MSTFVRVRGDKGLREVELSAGTIEYEGTGGEGPVLVLLHGLAQNGRRGPSLLGSTAGLPPGMIG
jgi:hypothetical protein